MGKPDSLKNFWLRRERELAKPILSKLLGHVIRQDKSMPLWGLFYTTEDALYFQTFKTTNWFSMLSGGGRNDNEDNRDQIIEIKASSISIFQVQQPKKKRLLPFLYKPEIIELSWVSEDNEESNMIIETDAGAQDFVATLTSRGTRPQG